MDDWTCKDRDSHDPASRHRRSDCPIEKFYQDAEREAEEAFIARHGAGVL